MLARSRGGAFSISMGFLGPRFATACPCCGRNIGQQGFRGSARVSIEGLQDRGSGGATGVLCPAPVPP